MMQRLATLSLILLAACGGGGESAGPPPAVETRLALSPDNQERVARGALQALNFSLDAASFGQGSPQIGGAAAPPVRALAVRTENVPCPRGGRLVVGFDDANNNGLPDAGDQITTELIDCAEQDGSVSTGKLVARITAFEASLGSSRVAISLDVQALSTVAANGDRQSGNGLLTASVAMTGTGVQTVTVESQRLDLAARVAGVDSNLTATGLRLTAITQTRLTPGRTAIGLSAQLAGSAFGGLAVSVETPAEFLVLDGESTPRSGQLLVRGANGSQLRLVALDTQQARVELDANGDGSFERSATYTWAQLGGWR